MNTTKEASDDEAKWPDKEGGAYWEDFKRDILGRDVRVTFPITKLAHDGGTALLRQWAIALHHTANELDALSQHQPGTDESTRLFYTIGALRRLASKVNRVMLGRRR